MMSAIPSLGRTDAPAAPSGIAPEAGIVAAGPRLVLRAEGAAVLAAATATYAAGGWSWAIFALAVLAPDLSMLGYLAGRRAGAALYNAAHSHVGPLAVALAGHLLGSGEAVAAALAWAAHIGFDRMLGYGLKYADGFGRTHLGRFGRR